VKEPQPAALPSLEAHPASDPLITGEMDAKAYFAHLEYLGETGKQLAYTGQDDAALAVRAEAENTYYTDPADEITLAVMEHRLGRGDTGEGVAAFDQISPNMRPWGIIKMLKHDVEPHQWQLLRYPLENSWAQYNLRQQREIIGDLLAMQEYDAAIHYANRMVPEDAIPPERRARRDTLIDIAHYRADYGDVQGGLDMLANLQAEAEAGLNGLIEQRMNLPEDPGANILLEEQDLTDTYNLAEMHTIAVRAHQSASHAGALLGRAAFYGENANDQKYRTMAASLLGTTITNLQLYEPPTPLASRHVQTEQRSKIGEHSLLDRARKLALRGMRRVLQHLRRR